MMTGGDTPAVHRAIVAELLQQIKKPDEHSNIVPLIRRQRYRGKWQFVVGYTWSRKPGRIYDRVLAAGYDADHAIRKLCERYGLARPATPTHSKHFEGAGPVDAPVLNGLPSLPHPHAHAPDWICKECDATNPGTWGRCRCGAFKH